jgi:hypothetical protein
MSNASDINPFEPLSSDTSPDDQSLELTDEQIRNRVARPGTALLIMASIFSVFPGIAIVSLGFAILTYGLDTRYSANLLVIGSYFLGQLIIAIGGAKMAFMESYRLARWGAILACIPIITPFLIWGLPFGIWALIVLEDPRVTKAFDAIKKEVD